MIYNCAQLFDPCCGNSIKIYSSINDDDDDDDDDDGSFTCEYFCQCLYL